MKRYLAGSDFPDEILRALERHLKACPDCMAEANSQREALGGAPVSLSQAVVSTHGPASQVDKLKAKFSRGKGATPEQRSLVGAPGENPYSDPLSAIKSPKNLALSGALAIVLILMSTVLRNPAGLLGPRASTKIKPSPAATVEDKTAEDSIDSKTDETKANGPKPDGAKTATDEVAGTTTDEKDTATPIDKTAGVKDPDAVSMHTTSKAPDVKAPVKKVKLDQVGGSVMVAEAEPPKKPVAKKVPTAQPKIVRHIKKPSAARVKRIVTRARSVRPAKAKSPLGVRVYMPDGSPRQH